MSEWQKLLGLLLFLLVHRKKKFVSVSAMVSAEPIVEPKSEPVRRPFIFEKRKSLAEIYRVSKIGVRPEKPQRKPKSRSRFEEVIFKRVASHALGQFIRAYFKARGKLGAYIDQRIEQKIGKRKVAVLEYNERIELRRVERHAISELLLNLARTEGRILSDNQERLEDGIDVIHIGRGPKNSYFVRFDPESGVVLGFYSAQGFNRHKAYRHSRKNSYRESVRRLS